MRKEKANWNLENMLQTRAFSELSKIQQDWVLQKISAQEYQEQRWVLLSSKEFFAEEEIPAPPPLSTILQAKRKSTSSEGLFAYFQDLTSWRVPAWQLGMAIVCGWIFGQWNAGDKNSGLNLVPQIVYQTDTIVREIPIYIGLGKQRYAAYKDSQEQKKIPVSHSPVRKREIADSNTSSIAADRDLLELAVGMQ